MSEPEENGKGDEGDEGPDLDNGERKRRMWRRRHERLTDDILTLMKDKSYKTLAKDLLNIKRALDVREVALKDREKALQRREESVEEQKEKLSKQAARLARLKDELEVKIEELESRLEAIEKQK